jgi:molybdopterin molybdotransferase
VLATGEDVTRGAPVIGVGRALRGPDLALAATLGLTEVEVVRRPRVRIVPTGDELVPLGRVRRGAEVIETNALMLGALAARDGAEVDVHPIVRDDEAALERAIRDGDADVVVVTGGSSVGKRDLGPVVVARVGALPVHGLHARPASPTGLGFVDGRLVLLAPGFPVASYVAWDLLGRVAVQRLSGLAPRWPYARVRATLAAALEKPAERVDVVRVTLEGEADGEAPPSARPIPGGAALISTLTRADGFVLVPEGVERWPAGTSVEVRTYEP